MQYLCNQWSDFKNSLSCLTLLLPLATILATIVANATVPLATIVDKALSLPLATEVAVFKMQVGMAYVLSHKI